MTEQCCKQVEWAKPGSMLGKEAAALLAYTRSTWSAAQVAAMTGNQLSTAAMLALLPVATQQGVHAALLHAERALNQLLHLAIDLRMLPASVVDQTTFFSHTVRTRVLGGSLLDDLAKSSLVRHTEYMWQYMAWGHIVLQGDTPDTEPTDVVFGSAADLELATRLRAIVPDVLQDVMRLVRDGLHVLLLRVVGEVPVRRRVTDWLTDVQLRRILDRDDDGLSPSGGWALLRVLLMMFGDGDTLEAQLTLTTVSQCAVELQAQLEEEATDAPPVAGSKWMPKEELMHRLRELFDANMEDMYHIVQQYRVPVRGVWLDVAYGVVDLLNSRKVVVYSRTRSKLHILQAHIAAAVRARTWVRNMLTLAHAQPDGVLASELLRAAGSPTLAARAVCRAARHFCNAFIIGQSMLQSRHLSAEVDALTAAGLHHLFGSEAEARAAMQDSLLVTSVVRVGPDGRLHISLCGWLQRVIASVPHHPSKAAAARLQAAVAANQTDMDVLRALAPPKPAAASRSRRAGSVAVEATHFTSKDTLAVSTTQLAVLRPYASAVPSAPNIRQRLRMHLTRHAVQTELILAAFGLTTVDRVACVLTKTTPFMGAAAWPMFGIVLATARHVREEVLRTETATDAHGRACTVCGTDTSMVCSTLTCDHVICVPCAVQLVETRVRDAAAGAADMTYRDFRACFAPGCAGVYTGVVEEYLTEDVRSMEAAVILDRRPVARQACAGCGDVHEPALDAGGCSLCTQQTCLGCGHVAHPGVVCDVVWSGGMKPDAVLSMVKAQACPGCRALTTKDGMCNHITCTSCPTHWCWACAARISASTPLEHYSSGPCAGLLQEYSTKTEHTRMVRRLEALAVDGVVAPELAKTCIEHLCTGFAQTTADL